jgi:hypothetical protein
MEDLSRFNQYRTPEPKKLNKLQENCCSKYHSDNVDCQLTECEKRNLKDNVAVTVLGDVNYSCYDACRGQSETPTETLQSKVTDTHDVLLHHASNKPDGMRDCCVQSHAGCGDTFSCLSQALK